MVCERHPNSGSSGWSVQLMVARKGPVFELYSGPDKQAAEAAANDAAAMINAETRRDWTEWRESALKPPTKEASDVAISTQTETD